MASKRRRRRRSCEGKRSHSSRWAAVCEAGRLRKVTENGRYKAYKCPFCGLWHVGRMSSHDAAAMARRRAGTS